MSTASAQLTATAPCCPSRGRPLTLVARSRHTGGAIDGIYDDGDLTGSGVRVYVVDTGVQGSHPKVQEFSLENPVPVDLPMVLCIATFVAAATVALTPAPAALTLALAALALALAALALALAAAALALAAAALALAATANRAVVCGPRGLGEAYGGALCCAARGPCRGRS